MAMDNYANKDFYDLLAEMEERYEAREAEEKKQRERREYLEALYKKVLGHYNGLNLSKYRQLHDYAAALDYGTDVFYEGEWVTAKSIETKEKYIKVVRRAYEELKEYEKILFEDWRELNSVIDKYGGSIIFPVDIQSINRMCDLCIMYHEKVEFLGEFIHEPGQTGEHGGSGRNQLPTAIDTPRAQECFKRAEERGYMEKTDTGHNWTFGGNRGKARLAYFLERVYCPNREDKMTSGAWRSLEKHFNVTRLDSAANQNAGIAGTQATVKKWRAEIDEITTKPKAK